MENKYNIFLIFNSNHQSECYKRRIFKNFVFFQVGLPLHMVVCQVFILMDNRKTQWFNHVPARGSLGLSRTTNRSSSGNTKRGSGRFDRFVRQFRFYVLCFNAYRPGFVCYCSGLNYLNDVRRRRIKDAFYEF